MAISYYSFVVLIKLRSDAKLQVPSRKITRFMDRCAREDGAILAVALYVFCTPRRSVYAYNRCRWRVYMAQCVHIYNYIYVSRNHGITGRRSWLMSLQGVPDRIISLVGAPRELCVLPPCERVNRTRRKLMNTSPHTSGCLLNTASFEISAVADQRARVIKISNHRGSVL